VRSAVYLLGRWGAEEIGNFFSLGIHFIKTAQGIRRRQGSRREHLWRDEKRIRIRSGEKKGC